MIYRTAACFIVWLGSVGLVKGQAENWPNWRGPLGTGVATNANPPLEWSDTKNLLWKSAIPGRGHSTPVVWGDTVFVTAAVAVGEKLDPKASGRPGAHDNLDVDSAHQFLVIAIDLNNGKERWRKEVNRIVPHEGGHYTASLASASPVTNGTHVYAFFGSHGLYCLDFDGNVIWSKQFGQMHTKHGHGEGSSPALSGDTLIVNWDHEEQSFVVALNAKTGEERWRNLRDEVTSWSSPTIVSVNKRRQAIVCGTDRVRAYDLKSGDTIWECGGLSANVVATPVFDNGVIYVGSSYDKRAMMAIRLADASGDITGTEHVLWTRTRGTPYVPSPLLYDGALYYLTHYQNILTRIDAEAGSDSPGAMRLGELRNIYASPVGAGGNVFITDLDGVTLVMTNTPIPRPVSVNRIGESVSASLAIVGNKILIRGNNHLFCIAKPTP